MGMIHAGYLGDFAVGAVIDLKFTTVDSSTGAPTAFDSGQTTVVYKANGTTESTAGVTVTEGFDGVAGMHHVRITTVSDGSFYAAGEEFSVVVKVGAIATVSHAGYVIGAFSISNRPVQGIGASVITATSIATDAITAAKVADGTIDAATFAAGAINAAAIASDAITDAKVAADVTVASVTGAVGSVTGAVGSVTGNVGGNVTGSVGSVVGAVGSVTGNVGGNVTGSVGSVASGGITATSIATDAIGSAEIAATAIAKIADAVLRRQCDNAEASSDGDTLDLSSLYGLIQQAQESAISGAVLTVKKTDGSTTLGTKAVTVDATTGNITAIS